MKRQSAFTTIELLLALALAATILATVYATYSATGDSVRKGSVHLENARQARRTLDTLTTHLRAATNEFSTRDHLCQFTAITRTGPRYITLRLDRSQLLIADSLSPEPENYRPLADGVKAVELRFFDGQNWSESWGSHKKNAIPRAIEITLTLASAATYTTSIALEHGSQP